MTPYRRAATGALAALFVALPSVPVLANAAPRATSEQQCGGTGSFGRFIAGEPRFDGDRGRIESQDIGATPVVLTRESLKLGTSVSGDRFGAAVAEGTVDSGSCQDLAVGSPGRNGGAGEVDLVLRGSDRASDVASVLPADVAAGDGLGTAIVINHATQHTQCSDSDECADVATTSDIWAGAPGATVDGKPGAGEILHWQYTGDSSLGTISGPDVVTQNSPGVPGAASSGDHFGQRLGDYEFGLLVGDPYESVAGHERAGRAYVLQVTSTGLRGLPFDENTKGVAGAPHAGDEFGAAVSISEQNLSSGSYQGKTFRSYLAIGVPGRSEAGHARAGAVQLFTYNDGSGSSAPGESFRATSSSRYTMNSKGVPGKASTGARFGDRIVGTVGTLCKTGREFDIAAPDATVNGRHRAGQVVALERRKTAPAGCGSRLLQRGGRLGGAAHTGDRLGAGLAADGSLARPSIVEVGIPGFTEGGVTHRGVVLGYAVDYTDGTQAYYAFRPANSEKSLTGVSFGSVLAS
jgi:hypothetical protein